MRFRRDRQVAPTAADLLRPLLYGDRSVDEWPPPGTVADGEPWASFVRARELKRSGDEHAAVEIWSDIATQGDTESRHVLQAWRFLRAAGVSPTPESASYVLAAVAEISVKPGHDLLVAYRDGGVRYLNQSGKVAIVEATADHASTEAARAWLAVADELAPMVGVWDQPQLPPLPSGDSRIMMLTPEGPRFGQGPDTLLREDAGAAAFLSAATNVLIAVTRLPPDGAADD
jgi:hypothetical protein